MHNAPCHGCCASIGNATCWAFRRTVWCSKARESTAPTSRARVKPTGPSFGTVRNGGATAARLSRSAATDHALGSKMRASAMRRSEEHQSELQSLMRNSYAVFCLKKKKTKKD